MKFEFKPMITILSVLLFLTSCGCVVLSYLWIDMSLSYTYTEPTSDNESFSYELATLLLERELSGLREDELMVKLKLIVKNSDKDVILKRDADKNIIRLENLSFKIENGRLKEIN